LALIGELRIIFKAFKLKLQVIGAAKEEERRLRVSKLTISLSPGAENLLGSMRRPSAKKWSHEFTEFAKIQPGSWFFIKSISRTIA